MASTAPAAGGDPRVELTARGLILGVLITVAGMDEEKVRPALRPK